MGRGVYSLHRKAIHVLEALVRSPRRGSGGRGLRWRPGARRAGPRAPRHNRSQRGWKRRSRSNPVKGDDCDEVSDALFPEEGSHPGKTICEPLVPAYGFSARTDDDGNCVLTLGNLDTSYTIKIRLPKWDAPEGADTRCYDKFIEDLRRHEEAHAEVCREHMPTKLEAAKEALDGLEVPLEGACEVDNGQIILSDAQEKQLDEAEAAALAAAKPYKDACEALDAAQEAIEADDSLNAVLDCELSPRSSPVRLT